MLNINVIHSVGCFLLFTNSTFLLIKLKCLYVCININFKKWSVFFENFDFEGENFEKEKKLSKILEILRNFQNFRNSR